MVNKLLNIDLPVELLEMIDKEFKLIRESDTKLLNIIRNYIVEHGFYQMYSLTHRNGGKYYLYTLEAMTMFLRDLLENMAWHLIKNGDKFRTKKL